LSKEKKDIVKMLKTDNDERIIIVFKNWHPKIYITKITKVRYFLITILLVCEMKKEGIKTNKNIIVKYLLRGHIPLATLCCMLLQY
jgi:hypothetical protein